MHLTRLISVVNGRGKIACSPAPPSSPWASFLQTRMNIQHAVKCGDVVSVKKFLASGVSVNTQMANGWTLVQRAAYDGNLRLVKLLVKKRAALNDTYTQSMGSCYALLYAAMMGHADIVKLLLKAGARKDSQRRNLQTSAHLAARNGHVHVLRVLIRARVNLNLRAVNGETPLHFAARTGHVEVVKVLIENGAHLEATTQYGFRPLHFAAEYGHLEVVMLLLNHSACVDAQRKNGETALHSAIRYGHQEIVQLLLAKDASIYLSRKDGLTALHIAARSRKDNILTILVESNGGARYGRTHAALQCQKGLVDVVRFLIENGAPVPRVQKYISGSYDQLARKR